MLVNIKKIIGKILNTPLIIEEGSEQVTTGHIINWEWRKWSDGTVECWGIVAPETYSFTTASGYAYYVYSNYSLPTNLFQTADVVFADRLQGTGSTPSNTLVTINIHSLTTSTVGLYIQSASNNAQSLAISLYVKGAWMALDPDSQTMIAPTFSQEQMSKASIRALIEGSGHVYRENSNWTPSDLL